MRPLHVEAVNVGVTHQSSQRLAAGLDLYRRHLASQEEGFKAVLVTAGRAVGDFSEACTLVRVLLLADSNRGAVGIVFSIIRDGNPFCNCLFRRCCF